MLVLLGVVGCGYEPRGGQGSAAVGEPGVSAPEVPPVTVPVEQPLDAGSIIGRFVNALTGAPEEPEETCRLEGGCRRPTEWQRTKALVGYTGPYYADGVPADPDAQGARVIPRSVRVLDTRTWQAIGLVRNETTTTMPAIRVRAELHARDGTRIETVQDTALVPGVRPGEPVPFRLTSRTPTEDVARVEWSADPVDNPPAERDVGLEILVKEGYGGRSRGPIKFEPYYREDPDQQVWPYALFIRAGAFFNHLALAPVWEDPPGRLLATPQVVVAWYDHTTGRLIRVEHLESISPTPARMALTAFLERDPQRAAEIGGLADTTIARWGYMQ